MGIIIVTPENHERSWLNFEAGALGRSIKAVGGIVAPLLINMGTTNIHGPMTTLQTTNFAQDDIHKLLKAINDRTRTPLTTEMLTDQIELLWPRLDESVTTVIKKHDSPTAQVLGTEEMLAEILTGIRELRRANDGNWAGTISTTSVAKREAVVAAGN